MKEISKNVFIETGFSGVTLGAISLPHGLILIDAPFLYEDIRSWRSALMNLGSGVDKILISMDSNPDRIIGTRSLECTVVSQNKISEHYQYKPITFKAQMCDTGAEWELHSEMTNIRWIPPEITFSTSMTINWGDDPLLLEYHPGPAPGSIWLRMPEQYILFIGDAVMPDQAPFIANADFEAWKQTLDELLDKQFQDYVIIGGRNDLIRMEDVRKQIKTLEKIEKFIYSNDSYEKLDKKLENFIQKFIDKEPYDKRLKYLYYRRLDYGIRHYYQNNIQK